MSATRLRAECEIGATALSAVLNLLEETGAVSTGREGSRYVGTDDDVDAVVRDALAVHATHVKLERSRVDMMRGYAEATDCRRRFLLGYFGDAGPVPCGGCDNCTGPAPERPGGTDRTDKAPARQRRWTRTGARAATPADAARSAAPDAPDHAYLPGVRVSHDQWGEGEVMSEGDGKITILFESVGYRTLSLAVVTDKQLLVALP